MPQTNKTPKRLRDRQMRRRGSLHVMVLAVTMIVGMMALVAMHVVRLNLKAATGRNNRHESAVLGASAVENAMIFLDNNPNWRSDLQNDVEYPSTPVSLGNGTFTWKLVDDDGDLADDLSDTVLLQGIGRVGRSTYVQQVLLHPVGSGLTCLEVAMHTQDNLSIGNSTVNNNQTISCNDSIDAWSSTVSGHVEAQYSVSGGMFSGTTATGITPRQMPDPGSVFDYYVANGTPIDVNSLPKWGGTPDIKSVVLSPAANPYGSGQTNSEGIYVIDLMGSNLFIRECRIVGTLVLLNPSSNCLVYQKEINWEPAVPNFPALLVSGNMQFQFDSTTLLAEVSVNFNPPGTPYEGQEDTDQVDTYPSVIKGLIYASGDLICNWGHPAFEGVLVAGREISISNYPVDLTYDSAFLDNPPPGFGRGNTMSILPGSWRHAASP